MRVILLTIGIDVCVSAIEKCTNIYQSMHICVPLIVIEEGRKLEINMWLLFPQPSCFLRDVLDKMHRARFLPYNFCSLSAHFDCHSGSLTW